MQLRVDSVRENSQGGYRAVARGVAYQEISFLVRPPTCSSFESLATNHFSHQAPLSMLFATQHKSIDEAVRYFKQVLSTGDYYLGTEIKANWNGRLAEQLGLDKSRAVTQKEFEAVLAGMHPHTGKKLSQRMRMDRRPGIDFTWSIPKSVSLLYAISEDERVITLLRETVTEVMESEVEPLVHRRVRDGKNSRTDNRKRTGKMLFADFCHLTSRPVNGVPDPHGHVHAFAINLTEDEGRYFAADYTEVMRRLPYLQAVFDAKLIQKLETELGVSCVPTTYMQGGRKKKGWEIDGVTRATIEKFSQRTAQIEEYAKEHRITSAEKKSQLGRITRESKKDDLTLSELRQIWRNRLSAEERKTFKALRAGEVGMKREKSKEQMLEAAVNFAVEHHLYRQSTCENHHIIATALEHGLGLQPKEIAAKLKEKGVIERSKTIDGAERVFVTTPEILKAEQEMISFARDSRGTRYAMGSPDHEFKRDWLNEQQKAAITHLLSSTDTVSFIVGGAGVGKTSAMSEAVEAIERGNKSVYCFAPSNGAKEVLQEEGFKHAETVEHLIRNEKLQSELKSGDVIWIDEASMLDTRSMSSIFQFAKATEARIVLSGDVRQHNSPRKGEAARLLLENAGLDVARIEKIQRQKGQYKQAIELISRGTELVKPGLSGLEAGFELLDKMGKVHELPAEERFEAIADKYRQSVKAGKSTLIVAPTHAEGDLITQELREKLIAAGEVGKEGREYIRLQSLHMTDAEKAEKTSYAPEGQVIQFHQNAKGFKKGERYLVKVEGGDVVLKPMGKGEVKPLPTNAASRFDVYSEEKVSFAKGDKIRFSLGGLATDKKRRVSNGRIDEVAGFDRWGNIRLKSGMTISRNFSHFDLGYCTTSYAAQGKTAQHTILAMGNESLPAIDARQWYVSASRGSEDIAVFVCDKNRVRSSIRQAREQMSATELCAIEQDAAKNNKPNFRATQRTIWERVRRWWQKNRPTSRTAEAALQGLTQAPKQPRFSR